VLLGLRLSARDAGPAVRRLCDVLVVSLGLVLAAPVLLVAALAIKLTSRGPILFLQERIGKNGRPFRMLKLRTMFVDADSRKPALVSDHGVGDVRFKMRSDPRITPVGRVLRRFSIDELPQLGNVLVGEMTLIGPRPPLGSEVARYDALAMRRLEVTQGLTCLWQVSGRSDIPFHEQLRLDLDYIDRATLADELRIITRTIPAVLSGRGAY
jgi:lipopolysaccharide/colanic/teichoic acid biosynthesis glycosyltransferase